MLDLALSGAPVAGIVLDKETRRPIAGAWVSASLSKQRVAARTSEDGRFELVLEPGEHRLGTSSSGYVQEETHAAVAPEGAPEVRVCSRGG